MCPEFWHRIDCNLPICSMVLVQERRRLYITGDEGRAGITVRLGESPVRARFGSKSQRSNSHIKGLNQAPNVMKNYNIDLKMET